MLVTFDLPIFVQFLSDTCFIRRYPLFLLWNISSIFHHWFSLSMALESTYMVRKWWGEVGFAQVSKHFHGHAHKINIARHLFCQPEAQWRVPVWFLELQRTGELSSADYSWVWPCDCNFYPNLNPASHVQNDFINYFWHELTQIHKYDQDHSL